VVENEKASTSPPKAPVEAINLSCYVACFPGNSTQGGSEKPVKSEFFPASIITAYVF
jgi:hypothetical protein